MTTKLFFTLLGLSLDFIGVVVIFIYGITIHLKTDGLQFLIGGKSESKKRKEKKLELRSKIGLLLIGFGFLFQIVGQLVEK